ncbi:MAG: hydrolase 2, exosortase A system-associated [Pseudomonadota bacterium]
MNERAPAAAAQPFFLPAKAGQRFCLYYAPAGAGCRGAVLYVHPFADEMNKSRRMAALQARALAALGYAVLQVDLYGCGDSSGEFVDARWDIWKDDLARASAWLDSKVDAPLILWGLRLGALLALDYARDAARKPARMLLWQPVHGGAACLTQFLRLLSANAMLAEAGKAAPEKTGGTAALKASLLDGQALEVAGYELASELAAAIEQLDAAGMAPQGCQVHWLEAVAAAERPLSPAVERQAAHWRAQGTALQLERVVCPPFWTTQEITVSDALLGATTTIFAA